MSRSMQDSGIEWIGQIPEGWRISKLKFETKCNENVLSENTSSSYEMKYIDIGSVTYEKGIGELQNFVFESAPSRARRIVREGDTIISTVRTYLKAIAYIDERHDGSICSTGFAVLQAKKNIERKFLFYSLSAPWFVAMIESESVGISYPAITSSKLINQSIVLPNYNEQVIIANYLDTHCTLIDQTIEKQRQVIEKLKEYKQSVITEAVTKGLNPNMPMKDSGIEWIGEIPESWEVFPIKYILKNKSVKNYPDEQVLSLYRDYGVVPKNSRDDNHNVTSEDTSSYKLVDVGDFVINKMKAWQGSMAISDFRGIISPAYYICEFVRNDINRKYFHFLMRNQLYLPEFRRLSTGMRIGQWDLSFDNFKLIPYIVPKKNEQDEIVEYLEGKCFEIDNAIQVKEKIIEKLESYKKSLIYECVTGKREVK